jgi:hypothetical protein
MDVDESVMKHIPHCHLHPHLDNAIITFQNLYGYIHKASDYHTIDIVCKSHHYPNFYTRGGGVTPPKCS